MRIPSEPFMVGTIYPIIMKADGKQATYDITTNLDAFLKAKKVM